MEYLQRQLHELIHRNDELKGNSTNILFELGNNRERGIYNTVLQEITKNEVHVCIVV